MATNESSTCPLCRHENVQVFAVGDCFHPVCYLCSVKMRILCEETYCAICRQDLPKIFLVSNLSETKTKIDLTAFSPIDDTGVCGIYYPTKSDWIRRKAEKLLRNFCPMCKTEFESFDLLRRHVQQKHRALYCDLCVEHLNLFPHERKYYTRAELVQHLRQGDKDDKSMRGHPLCKFCNDHFLDNDQLYKHMRQEHHYCHLCTSDSVYYSTFALLRDHYRSAHFLCEIDQCRDVQFTNVFPNEFEFRAHQAAQHSKNRATARQLGKVQVEFQSTNPRDRRQQRETTSNNVETQNEETNREANATANVPSIDEFPTLGRIGSSGQISSQRGAWGNDLRGNYSNADFPSLPTTTSNSSQPRGFWGENPPQVPMTTTTRKPTVADSSSTKVHEDFPALQPAANSRILPSVSLVSAWSNAKKSAKNANTSKRTVPRQTRMNSNRILNDNNDDDEESIRRPMSTLLTSTTPQVSSNITIISSNDVNSTTTTSKNQSMPKSQDFPALPTTVRPSTATPVPPSGAWATPSTQPQPQPTTSKQQKKKSGVASKKKFLEEIRVLSENSDSNDVPMVGLSELGRRLITEETPEVRHEEKISPRSTENENEKKTTTSPSKKKKSPKITSPSVVPSESIRPPPSISPPVSVSSTTKSTDRTELNTQNTQAPPGFSASNDSVEPPPGFKTNSTFVFSSSYEKDKEQFRDKLLKLFDGDMNLMIEYDKFCQSFTEKNIKSDDFLKFTRELFHEKFNEYFLDLIVLIPNIDQQNELWTFWKNENPTSTSNWTKKMSVDDQRRISQCQHCHQLILDENLAEHKSHHIDFNADFPSLPSASVSIGRGKGGKKNK